MRRAFIGFFVVLVVLLGFSCALFAQYGTGQAPKPAAAEDKAGPAPTHDLTGVWMMRNPPGSNRGYTNFTFTDPKTAPPSLTAWGEEKFKEAKDSNGGNYTLQETNDPVLTKCYPPGVPRVYFHPYPFEFVHTPKVTLMLFEYDHTIRRIYTDGRPLPKDPDPLWLGISVGRWEGNTTLVVESTGFNEKTWLDRIGHAHSDQLHVTERFRRVDKTHLELDITMEDPKALAKPWTATFYYQLAPPSWELGEISCSGDYLDWSTFEDFNKKN
jgi:hypothetical protein